MQALYSLNLSTLEHVIICNGVSARFDISGKYQGIAGNIPMNAIPVDCFSILQQGNLCEVAVLASECYTKRVIPLSKAQTWVSKLPFMAKATFTIKRKIDEKDKCVQTIYIYPFGKLGVYLPQLFNS